MIVAVIPARYNSSRFPGKPLAKINGKSMIQHVYERVKKSTLLDNVVVATDHKRIIEACKMFNGNVVRTRKKHFNGTSRCLEAIDII